MLYLLLIMLIVVGVLVIGSWEKEDLKIRMIKVRYFDQDQTKIKQHDKGDWIDIPTPHKYKYKKGDTVWVKLGVAIKLPENYEAILAPRSSTFKQTGLIMANSIGIIDNSYCGNNDEWSAMFYATRDGEVEEGQRLVQFRILENQPNIPIIEVENTYSEDRGGYGTTGK